MFVSLNGKIVPEEQAVISAFDRGFLYGDGLFETMRVLHGRPFRWQEHMQRLYRGAQFLEILLPRTAEHLRAFSDAVLKRNAASDCMLRIVVSRGIGARGYSPSGARHPTIVISTHPAPADAKTTAPAWRLVTSSVRIDPSQPLTQYKTCNKLPQILARLEADRAGAHEALLLNSNDFVVEGSASNLFWIIKGEIFTAPIAAGILPGITRAAIQEICRETKIPLHESTITRNHLLKCEGVFLSLSSVGIARALSLDGIALQQSPIVEQLFRGHQRMLTAETQ